MPLEMMFRSAGVVPPIVLLEMSSISTPVPPPLVDTTCSPVHVGPEEAAGHRITAIGRLGFARGRVVDAVELDIVVAIIDGQALDRAGSAGDQQAVARPLSSTI